MDLTSADVQDILQLIDSMPVHELHLKTSRFTLSLRRADDGEWTQELQLTSAPNVLAGDADPPARTRTPTAEPPAGAGTATPAVSSEATTGVQTAAVLAPLLGTFYRAPRPGAPPFVEVGSRVEPDTVVGIIETMKLMNSVSAGLHGTVTEILVADAQFAPQGTPLMRVDVEATGDGGAPAGTRAKAQQ